MSEALSSSQPEVAALPLLRDLRDGVLCLTFNRPERLNASTPEMIRLYMETMLAAADDPEVRVIVITGAGKGFCAGADSGLLNNLAAGQARPVKLRRHWFTTNIPKPVIGAINGVCVGVGFAMAMMCDMRFAARSARIGPGFATLGLPAENGTAWVLTRTLGLARAMEVLMAGRLFVGEELMRLGLVNDLIDDDQLLPRTLAMARDMAERCSPRSLAMMKSQVLRSLDTNLPDSDALANALISMSVAADDFKEAMQSRKEKRSAIFGALAPREAWWPDESKIVPP